MGLQESNRLLAAISRAQTHFLDDDSPQRLFDDLLNDFLALTGSEYGFVGEVLEAPNGAPFLRTRAISDVAWDEQSRAVYRQSRARGVEFRNLDTLFGQVIRSHELLIDNNPSAHERSAGFPEGHPPLNAFLGMPVMAGNVMVGVVGVANRKGGYDGELVDYIRPLVDTYGRIISFMRANKRRSELEARLSAIVDSAADAILVIDETGVIESCNKAVEAIFGYAQHEMTGRNISMLMPEPYCSQHSHFLRQYIDTGVAKIIGETGREVSGKRADGEVFPMFLSVAEFWVGKERFFSGIVRDISKLKDAQLEQQRFKEILDQVHDCVFMFDADSLTYVYVNQGAMDHVGYSKQELLEMHPFDLKPTYDEIAFRTLIDPLRTSGSGSLTYTTQHQHKEGHLIPVEISLQYILREEDVPLFVAVVRDIRDRIEAERALRESDERLRHSQVFANIGTWDWNIQTGDLFWSERIAPLFGYEQGQIETTYENFLAAVHPDDRQAVIDAVAACVDHSAEYNIEHRVVWPSGEVHWVLERGDVIRNEAGEAIRMLGVVQDISDKKEAEMELKAAKEEAERASRAKSEFLSSMSHELRTPLNAMMGFAQLFEYDPRATDEQQANAREIYRAGKHLSTLIDEVLDLAKIEAGHLKISSVPVMAGELLEECRSLVMPIAEKSSVRLYFEMNRQFDVCVLADYTRLKQVFLNLLSNAIKYNIQGGEVVMSCQQLDDNYVRFSVTDTGIGIHERDKSSVFNLFSRLHTDMVTVEGTGIGLNITQQFVEAMGGRIGFDSEFGKGSTFWIDLRLSDQCDIEPGALVREEPSVVPDERKRVVRLLLAEDNPTNQVVFRRQIQILGYLVDIANDGIEALDMFKHGDYDLVLTDIHMPHMDGYAFAKALRKYEQQRGGYVPLIAATANAMQGERERCMAVGMDDYLSKPIDMEVLRESVERLLQLHGKPGVRVANHIPLVADQRPLVDLAALAKVLGSDSEAHAEVIDNFIANVSRNISDIHRACNGRSARDLAFSAHRFKSSARTIGAHLLADGCQAMEEAAKRQDWHEIMSLEGEIDSLVQRVVLYLKEHQAERKVLALQPPELTARFEMVLVVDDDPFVLDVMEVMLREMGIEMVCKAPSGHEALRQMDDLLVPVDLVICDLNMPEMDGIEYLRHLAGRSYQGAVVLLSGEDSRILNSARELARAHSFKSVAAIKKPVHKDELVQLLNSLEPTRRFARPAQAEVALAELKMAIAQDEFILYFQPKVAAQGGALVGTEALVRWQKPDGTFVMPDQFIPLAEREGLIDELTDLVLEKAMQQVATWRAQGFVTKVAVNIAVGTIERRLNFPEQVVAYLDKYQLEPTDVILEITESGVMGDIATTLDSLVRLRLKGFTLSIDDFGTGYSTFKQLQGIPFGELKVDRSFVSGADSDPASRAILESSVLLGQKLGMEIVAEGVETQEDWELIERLGCQTIQGYFVSRPLPGGELPAWYEEWRKR